MGDYNKDSEQDNSIDCMFRELKDFSDEDLLKEFEASSRLTIPSSISAPAEDEFDRIWTRVQDEKALFEQAAEARKPVDDKVIRGRFGWKRLAAIGLIACLVAGSGCMVAMGTKSYFFREKELDGIEGRVYVNDNLEHVVNGEEEAYALVKEELGIEPLKLGYIPEEMVYTGSNSSDGYIVMSFLYNDDAIYFTQSKNKRSASLNYDSDTERKPVSLVHNKWLDKDFSVYSEVVSDGKICYESVVVVNGAFYSIIGFTDLEVFSKVLEGLMY